jgi:putative aldouronate transport system substrate-binding protein
MSRVYFALLALALVVAGCKGKGDSGGSSASGEGGVVSYPIKTDVTLTYWVALDGNESANFANRGDMPIGKALMEKTGIKIEFQHPPAGNNAARDQLNLMIAAGDNLPDIIEYTNWVTDYVGGPEKAMADGALTKLNDVIDKWAPNLKSYLAAHPSYAKMARTDDGSYYAFPFFRDGEKLLYSQGLMIRKDWLDELGLQPPTTIDEWHDVLSAFKDKKGAQAPFTMVFTNRMRMFVPSFGILWNFYIGAEDGKVHYGQIEDGCRRWISTMAQWYKEGLIDKDLATITVQQQNQKMTAGTAGATVASVGSGMGTWTAAARQSNPSFTIMALDYPSLTKDGKRVYSIPGQVYTGQGGAGITSNSKNVEIAARYLDYGYTQEGHNLYNFGTEGVSFTMVDGKPTYTAEITSNPNKWSFAQALAAYARGGGAGPFAQDEGYITQYYALPEQAQALVNYVVPGADKYILPAVTPSQEESRELASIINEINTYVDERLTKWILGTDTLTDAAWNDYISTIKKMNVDRAIALQQAALDRYTRR